MNADDLLKKNREKILSEWRRRTTEEVASAFGLAGPALENSIPIFVDQLVLALSERKKVDTESVRLFDIESVRIGKLHGMHRSRAPDFLLTEVIREYQILRQVTIKMLEEHGPISQVNRDIIWDMIDQAANDAAVQFTDAHLEIRTQLTNALTHDLRSPLTSAISYADLIQHRTDDPDISHPASRIKALLKRLDNMITDLLDASLVRAGQEMHLEVINCDLEDIVRRTVEDMALGSDRKRLEIQTHGKVRGRFAHDGIRRAVENLVGNALKYSSENTPVTVTLKKTDRGGKITVHNMGPVISKSDQELLFQQYRRLKNMQKPASTGWGLGLTLIRGVSEFHHGTVKVESTEKDGTRFILDLPSIANDPR